jgi:hypothetical protein
MVVGEETTTMKNLIVLALVVAAAACGGASRTSTTTQTAAGAADDALLDAVTARRAEAVERLHAYRVAGVYPTDDAGLPLGVFRDARGVRCPMSELIYQSGRADLVDEVVRTDNALRLAEVHDGALMAWMLESGLTKEEIVEIQGVMELDHSFLENLNNANGPSGQSILVRAAREQVDDKLAAVEAKLARQRTASLATVVARLAAAERAGVVARAE